MELIPGITVNFSEIKKCSTLVELFVSIEFVDQRRRVQTRAVVVNHQANAVQIGLESGLYDQRCRDALGKRSIRLADKRFLLGTEGHQTDFSSGDHPLVQNGLAIELLARRDLRIPRGPVSGKFRYRRSGTRTRRRVGQGGPGLDAGGHSAGFSPALHQRIEMTELLVSGAVLRKLCQRTLQGPSLRAAQAQGGAKVAHGTAALHLG